MGATGAAATSPRSRSLQDGHRPPDGRRPPADLHLLTTGQLDRDLSAAAPRTRVQRPAKLEPYKPIIEVRLATYPELSAIRLFDEVRAAGYRGGIRFPPQSLSTACSGRRQ